MVNPNAHLPRPRRLTHSLAALAAGLDKAVRYNPGIKPALQADASLAALETVRAQTEQLLAGRVEQLQLLLLAALAVLLITPRPAAGAVRRSRRE